MLSSIIWPGGLLGGRSMGRYLSVGLLIKRVAWYLSVGVLKEVWGTKRGVRWFPMPRSYAAGDV